MADLGVIRREWELAKRPTDYNELRNHFRDENNELWDQLRDVKMNMEKLNSAASEKLGRLSARVQKLEKVVADAEELERLEREKPNLEAEIKQLDDAQKEKEENIKQLYDAKQKKEKMTGENFALACRCTYVERQNSILFGWHQEIKKKHNAVEEQLAKSTQMIQTAEDDLPAIPRLQEELEKAAQEIDREKQEIALLTMELDNGTLDTEITLAMQQIEKKKYKKRKDLTNKLDEAFGYFVQWKLMDDDDDEEESELNREEE